MTTHIMNVRIRSIHQLFSSLDPSPFVDRDLDSDAEAYIVSWAREFPRRGDFRLVLHLDEFPEDATTEPQVRAAVQNYFGYRENVATRDFALLMREGRLSLAIGLVFLTLCLLGSRAITGYFDYPGLDIVSEGLVIGGWVAMWRPMQIFLYDWWPLARRRSIFQRLARMDVLLQRANHEDRGSEVRVRSMAK